MKKIASIIVLLIFSVAGFTQTLWKADPNHSALGFTIRHFGITDVPGYFENFSVTVTASKADFSDAVLEMTAAVNSVNTRIDKRDAHLRSADFFDVEKYPEMIFKSTSIKKVANHKYKLSGNLTLHGVTKPVTVDLLYRGTSKNPAANNAPIAGLQVTGVLKRSDFGIGDSFPAPMLSDEVWIKADGEFGK